MTAARDSDDLEALFDQISSETLAKLDAIPVSSGATPAASTEVQAESSPAPTAGGSAPLAAAAPAVVVAVASQAVDDNPEVYLKIGTLTRQLHDALRELGYDKAVESAVTALPDTRQRLDYIARLTGQAAERALSNVESGQALQFDVQERAASLQARWDRMFARELSVDDFRDLALDSRDFMEYVHAKSEATNALFTDIMMAQDFHDLTGQVIQKVVGIAQNMEEQLLKILIEATPPEKRASVGAEWLAGPVIESKGRDDVVTSQAQVDDLLESLGF